MNATAQRTIRVEVAYARPEEQVVVTLEVPMDCTVGEAVRASGILERFPEIDLGRHKVGIFGRPARLEEGLRERDRVEIYRPLKADPKEMRRQRARRQGR